MAWECERCRTIHTQNPSECRSCGHKIFSPINDRELERRTDSNTSVESSDISEGQTMGTSKDPNFEKSPDVAKDGSVKAGGTSPSPSVDEPATSSGSGAVRSVYNWLRGTFRAPFLLLREYLIPILAFLLVFGTVAYIVLSM